MPAGGPLRARAAPQRDGEGAAIAVEVAPIPDLIEDRRGDVLWLTFNRPQARNAMTFEMYDRLGEVCRQVNQDDSLRCLVLTGAGEKAFVAGTDISQFKEFRTEQDATDYEARMEREIGALAQVRIPTIAAVRGACTGGGFAIAGCCDLRVGSPSARFGLPIARTLGNTLSMASLNLVVELLGPSSAKELIFTARLMEAPEAREVGLLNELVDSEESLIPRVEALAQQIAANAPITIRTIKEGVRRILARRRLDPAEGRDLIVQAYLSDDFREGMAAFLEKRKPNWRGK